MKFIHIADVHLGAEPDAGPLYSKIRPQELWSSLESVVKTCEEEQIDLLLIAGDLFHRQPLMRELKEADAIFAELTHTKVVLIAGNHDYVRKDSNYRTFKWNGNVYPLLEKTMEYVDFPEFETAVYGMSYHSREIRENVCAGVRACGAKPIEILLAHGGDERHIPLDVRDLERSGFDYVALGHIHKPQAVIRDQIVYAGALEPIDRNDTGPHGYVKGEITSRGVHTVWIPCAKRAYIHLEVHVDEKETNGSVRAGIREQIRERGSENIYKIILRGKRDADIVFDAARLTEGENITEIVDETSPAYDFDRLYEENKDTILGKYIGRFRGCREGSVEYRALCEGVDALLGSRE
nr:exonuclease SbcCD subunit D [uncultured Mediterraneibacter sp.]